MSRNGLSVVSQDLRLKGSPAFDVTELPSYTQSKYIFRLKGSPAFDVTEQKSAPLTPSLKFEG